MSKQRSLKAQSRRNQQHVENTISFEDLQTENQPRFQKQRPINLVPRTRNQEKLVLALQDESQHIVLATGPAGTGKTYICMVNAVKALREGLCERIVLVRPAVAVEGESHGFLPGDLNQKLEPWCLPLLDVLNEYYRPQEVARMIENKVVEIAPLGMMRGRTLKGVYLIADEMQNSTPNMMMMMLTRIGEGSKFMITGDSDQTDRKGPNNGLLDLCQRLQRSAVRGVSLCEFDHRDIQRHQIIGPILKLYEE